MSDSEKFATISNMDNINEVKIENKTPVGIKIISILLFIISLIFIYTFTIGFSSMRVQEIADKTPGLNLPSNFFSEVNVVGVIFFIILIILGIFLWRRANWARISIIIILAFGIIFSFPTTIGFLLLGQLAIQIFIFNAVPLVLAIFVLFYLTFNKKVRPVFNSGEVPKSTKIFTGVFVVIIILMFFGIISTFNPDKKGSLANYSAEESNKFIGSTIYENTHYKFRLTYPVNSIVRPTHTETGFIIRFILPGGQTIANDPENIGIYIKENSRDLESYLQNEKNRYSKNGPIDVQEIQFGKQKGYKMILTSDYTFKKGTKEAYYFTVKDNILYMLNYFPVVEENIKIVDNVAESFEFTD